MGLCRKLPGYTVRYLFAQKICLLKHQVNEHSQNYNRKKVTNPKEAIFITDPPCIATNFNLVF